MKDHTGDVYNGFTHYGFNGFNASLRKKRARLFRGTERVLRTHGWRTINGQPEYVGKGRPRRPNSRKSSSQRGVHRILNAESIGKVESFLDLSGDGLAAIAKHHLGNVRPVRRFQGLSHA